MMEQTEQLVFSGPLSIGSAVALAVVSLAIIGWLLIREQRGDISWRPMAFFLLRTCALSGLLWMLVGPTNQITESESGAGTVAILVDHSPSMNVVDSPRHANDLRWALAAEKTGATSSQIADTDRAAVACGLARRHAEAAVDALQGHQPTERIVAALDTCHRALSAAVDRLDSAQKELHTNRQDRLSSRAEELRNALDELRPELVAYTRRIGSQSELATHHNQTVADELVAELAGLQRRILRFADRVATTSQLSSQQLEQIVGTTARQTRREKVQQTLSKIDQQTIPSLDRLTRVKRFQFDESLVPFTAESTDAAVTSTAPPSTGGTDLSQAMEDLGKDADAATIETVVLLTDGRHTVRNRKSPPEIAALNDMAVYVVPVGDTKLVKDISLYRVEAPSVVIQDDMIVIDTIIMATELADEIFTVELVQNGEVIDAREAHVPSVRADIHMSFTARATELGRHEFELRIPPLDDESSEANNSETFVVEVTTSTISVLLADDRPRFEYQFLRNLLNRTDTLTAEELLFSPQPAGTGSRKNAPALPDQMDDWSRYRAVILGDVTPAQLDSRRQQTLNEWVSKRGGALIVIGGSASMPQAFRGQPLMELLPVQESFGIGSNETFLPTLTNDGASLAPLMLEDNEQQNRDVWDRVYRRFPIHNLSQYSQPKPSARVLLRATSQLTQTNDTPLAFLSWHQVGRGKVIYLAAPETFRLRFRNGDLYHYRFWGQLLRWATAADLAAGTSRVRIRADKDNYIVDEPVQVAVQLRDEDGTPVSGLDFQIVARSASQNEAVVAANEDASIPGRYTGTLSGLASGEFQITVAGDEVEQLAQNSEPAGTAETTIVVSDAPNVEMVDTRCDYAMISQIADVTGGQVIPPTAIGEVLRLAISPKSSITNQSWVALWNQWWLIGIIFACLLTEWIIRKRIGWV